LLECGTFSSKWAAISRAPKGRIVRTFSRLIAACAAVLCSAAASAQNLVDVVEFYNAGLDHYFISSLTPDIHALDSGQFPGWVRTGLTFKAYDGPAPGTSPVCRFYLPPQFGDSHFYSASPAECSDVRSKFPGFDYESAAVMYVGLPDPATGACAAGMVPVFRTWDDRVDTNHRYTTDPGIRAQMLAKGYVPEGYGPDGIAMCAVAPSTSLSVSVSAHSMMLLPGGARDVYATITPYGGSVGNVNLAVSGLPVGVSSQFTNGNVNVGASAVSTTLHLTVAGDAAATAGDATVTMSATDGAGRIAATTFTVGIAAGGDPTAAKLAAIYAVEDHSAQISGQHPSATDFAQMMATFMSTRPEYVSTGVDADSLSAWGIFADGTAHVVTNNREVPTSSVSAAKIANVRKDGAALPQSVRAHLMGSFVGIGAQGPISDMRQYLQSKHWTVYAGPEGQASVETLRSTAGDGFFYLNTHGGRTGVKDTFGEPDNKIYAIQSSTLVDFSFDKLYNGDLATLALVHFTASQGEITLVPGPNPVTIDTFDTRYGITYKFVQQYMSFAGNSVVLMNACYSALNGKFVQSFLGKGAGAYLGWTDKVSPNAAFAAAPYFVDRMLGANLNSMMENPPQRAFPYDLVLQDMASKGLDTDGSNGAKLVGFRNGTPAGAPIFAPSIRRVWVQENDGTLHIEGDFTADNGAGLHVTVGGSDVAIKSLAADEIQVQLPGPTTSGDVVVEINGVPSNARQLTEWSIPVTYTWNPALFQGFQMQGNGTIRMRADIAGYRMKPGGSLTYLYTGGLVTKDSALQITGSGSYAIGGGCTAKLSGTRNFVSILSGGIPHSILGAEFGIDGNLRQGALSILIGATDESGTFMETYSGNCTTPPDQFIAAVGVQDGAVSVPSDGSDNPQTLSLPEGIKLLLDANYAIQPVNRGSLPAPGVQNGGMVVYSWPLVSASAPPRDTPDSGK